MLEQFNSSQRVQELTGRVERCCCRYCGSPLEIKRITFSNFEDARLEIFCTKCDRIEYGTEPEIYKCAKYFVEHYDFNWYTYMDENAQTQQMTIAKICDILSWQNRLLGFMNQDGFAVPLHYDKDIFSESLTLDDEMLDALDAEEKG
ncbi:MAG: hypothetical protein Q4C56_02700 [Peptococcaceae bacterium]|nr:hypothetical protein [Peptococcaceae bacterium]